MPDSLEDKSIDTKSTDQSSAGRRHTRDILHEYLPELEILNDQSDKKRRGTLLSSPTADKKRLSIYTVAGQEDYVTENEAVTKLKKIELIDNHKDKLSRLHQLKNDVYKYRKLLYETRDQYDLKKRFYCTCFGAPDLENIILKTITQLTSEGWHQPVKKPSEPSSPIARLVNDARRFTYLHHAIVGVELAYASMTHEKLVEEMIALEAQIQGKEIELKELESRGEHFIKGYKAFKRKCFCNPYSPLARLLETFTFDCLTNEDFDSTLV